MKRIGGILLAVLLAVALCTACRPTSREDEPQTGPALIEQSQPEEEEEARPLPELIPDYGENVAASLEINSDTVGWLRVPGTEIGDAVVHKPEDETNKYYERLDLYQNFSFNGLYFADCTSDFGDGTRESIGVNTCIYGHTISDDPDSEKYMIKFGQLHDFRDPGKAENLPYLYFSTGVETLVFEVFAVFTANCDNLALPYNRNLPVEEFLGIIREEVLPRSLYDYDVELTEEDKFLTLSTCIYNMPDGTKLPTENWLRMGIMGKLLPPDAQLKEKAVFTENPDLVIDRDGAWDN